MSFRLKTAKLPTQLGCQLGHSEFRCLGWISMECTVAPLCTTCTSERLCHFRKSEWASSMYPLLLPLKLSTTTSTRVKQASARASTAKLALKLTASSYLRISLVWARVLKRKCLLSDTAFNGNIVTSIEAFHGLSFTVNVGKLEAWRASSVLFRPFTVIWAPVLFAFPLQPTARLVTRLVSFLLDFRLQNSVLNQIIFHYKQQEGAFWEDASDAHSQQRYQEGTSSTISLL